MFEKLFEAMMVQMDPTWGAYSDDRDASGLIDRPRASLSHTVSFPIEPFTKDGRLKRTPAACLFIAQHPGCTKDEIQAAIKAQGWTSKNVELFTSLSGWGVARTRKEGRIKRYYPSYACIDYLKRVGLLDEDLPYVKKNTFIDDRDDDGRADAIKKVATAKEEPLNDIDFEDD